MFASRRLHRSCEARLSDLPIPTPFTVEGLMANIERVRGGRFHLVAVQDDTDMRRACGLRVKVNDSTFILFRRRPTQPQTNHVILHEVAHEWLGHSSTLTTSELEQLLPSPLRQVLQRYGREVTLQARARYGTAEEQEAELGAYVIERLASQRQRSAKKDDFVSRLESSLTHPMAPPRDILDSRHGHD